MILRCEAREILGLCDEIARLRARVAAVEVACLELMGKPYWTKVESLNTVRAIARGEVDRCA